MDLPRSRGSEIYSVVEGRQLDGRKSSRFSLQTSRLLSCTGASAASCPLFAVHFLASVCFGRATSIFSKGFLSADAREKDKSFFMASAIVLITVSCRSVSGCRASAAWNAAAVNSR